MTGLHKLVIGAAAIVVFPELHTTWHLATPRASAHRSRSPSSISLAFETGAPGDFVSIIGRVKFAHARPATAPLALLSVEALAPKSLPSTPSRRPACGRAADSPTSCAPSRSNAAW